LLLWLALVLLVLLWLALVLLVLLWLALVLLVLLWLALVLLVLLWLALVLLVLLWLSLVLLVLLWLSLVLLVLSQQGAPRPFVAFVVVVAVARWSVLLARSLPAQVLRELEPPAQPYLRFCPYLQL
jgi:hypothetical protein